MEPNLFDKIVGLLMQGRVKDAPKSAPPQTAKESGPAKGAKSAVKTVVKKAEEKREKLAEEKHEKPAWMIPAIALPVVVFASVGVALFKKNHKHETPAAGGVGGVAGAVASHVELVASVRGLEKFRGGKLIVMLWSSEEAFTRHYATGEGAKQLTSVTVGSPPSSSSPAGALSAPSPVMPGGPADQLDIFFRMSKEEAAVSPLAISCVHEVPGAGPGMGRSLSSLGVPRNGVGFSRDAKINPMSSLWADASFKVDPNVPSTIRDVTMSYFLPSPVKSNPVNRMSATPPAFQPATPTPFSSPSPQGTPGRYRRSYVGALIDAGTALIGAISPPSLGLLSPSSDHEVDAASLRGSEA